MTDDDRLKICKAITVSCMWGHEGIGRVIADRLDKELPMSPTWSELLNQNAKNHKREHIGTIHDADQLWRLLDGGYTLANFDEDGCSLFYPWRGGGIYKYVSKDIVKDGQPAYPR